LTYAWSVDAHCWIVLDGRAACAGRSSSAIGSKEMFPIVQDADLSRLETQENTKSIPICESATTADRTGVRSKSAIHRLGTLEQYM
jgi:hypothetical protein